VVDVQPEYSGTNDGYENPVFEEIIKFANAQTEPILMFVNAEETMTTIDTIQDIKIYWEDSGFDNENWKRVTIVDKGYRYFRSWMDRGDNPSTIIKVIRGMYAQRVNDSRDLFGGELAPGYDDAIKKLIGPEYRPYDLDDPLVINWTSVSLLKSLMEPTL
jgi:hypothetical protein